MEAHDSEDLCRRYGRSEVLNIRLVLTIFVTFSGSGLAGQAFGGVNR